jgi:hypothetical protein
LFAENARDAALTAGTRARSATAYAHVPSKSAAAQVDAARAARMAAYKQALEIIGKVSSVVSVWSSTVSIFTRTSVAAYCTTLTS